MILTLGIVQAHNSTATYGWVVKNVGNAISTETSGGFVNIYIKSIAGFLVSKFTPASKGITN
jgi:hypothetical protein